MRIDWGDAAGWAQAVGNIALWVLTLITVLRDRRRINELEAEAARQRQEAERGQARLVSAWPDEWGQAGVRGRCLNASPEPVYRVTVRARPTPDANGAPTPDERGCVTVPLMRPHEELSFTVDAPTVADRTNTVVHVDLRLTDASGRTWWRRADGTLRRLS